MFIENVAIGGASTEDGGMVTHDLFLLQRQMARVVALARKNSEFLTTRPFGLSTIKFVCS